MNIVFKTAALSLYHWGYMGAVMAITFVIGTVMTRLINR